MGNASSCAPLITSSNGVVKVLPSSGTMQIYTKPVKAAEIMLENPGQFLCNSSSLKVGQRIQGLSADEELERRQLYFLLPMDLLYSVLTQEEMSSLTYKSTRAFKPHNLGKLISPMFCEFCIFPSDSMTQDNNPTCSDTQLVENYSTQRSWKPALDTILET